MGIRASLIARRDTIGVELEAVRNSDKHNDYKMGLYAELESIMKLLEDPTLDQTGASGNDQGPFEVETRGIT